MLSSQLRCCIKSADGLLLSFISSQHLIPELPLSSARYVPYCPYPPTYLLLVIMLSPVPYPQVRQQDILFVWCMAKLYSLLHCDGYLLRWLQDGYKIHGWENSWEEQNSYQWLLTIHCLQQWRQHVLLGNLSGLLMFRLGASHRHLVGRCVHKMLRWSWVWSCRVLFFLCPLFTSSAKWPVICFQTELIL